MSRRDTERSFTDINNVSLNASLPSEPASATGWLTPTSAKWNTPTSARLQSFASLWDQPGKSHLKSTPNNKNYVVDKKFSKIAFPSGKEIQDEDNENELDPVYDTMERGQCFETNETQECRSTRDEIEPVEIDAYEEIVLPSVNNESIIEEIHEVTPEENAQLINQCQPTFQERLDKNLLDIDELTRTLKELENSQTSGYDEYTCVMTTIDEESEQSKNRSRSLSASSDKSCKRFHSLSTTNDTANPSKTVSNSSSTVGSLVSFIYNSPSKHLSYVFYNVVVFKSHCCIIC